MTEPSGPDLSIGIGADGIRPGDKLLGHVKEEAVLLARLDTELVAVSARCTHYGGPLADGVIDGETVRCPWHHACFSLRTGEALRAPALNPVACWKIERRGGKAVVSGKSSATPSRRAIPDTSTAPRCRAMSSSSARARPGTPRPKCCAGAARRSHRVVDDDPGAPYDRPNLSKDYLAGSSPEESLPLRPDGFYEQHDVELIRGRVTRLDTIARAIAVDGHGSIRYDALLIATGAEPVRINLAGEDQPHVHYLRSLADSRAIVEAASPPGAPS